ncbi:hypothetical protein J1605_022794 [Eschrichtius robustus]|uniref:RING finger and CHY zinc finger domain-containing protein 1 n=1 Tax=Eschrichtius robustus TaxID=9764 RepID=A0AB34H796_ESCRO|nr:hypothetical protein J1605_022794 [Eschrichtius robustus]
MAASAREDGARGQAQGRRGCEHYDRGCRLKAPCCDKLYSCRLCHDNSEDHLLDRFKVKEVQCINCEKIQRVRFYHKHNRLVKNVAHCLENIIAVCAICLTKTRNSIIVKTVEFVGTLSFGNFSFAFKQCIENVSRQNCPICLEDIHTSRIVAHVLPCGHLLHRTCYEEMLKEGYRCPLCMHSALDMTRYWRQLDDEVAHTPMPSEYQNMTVDICLKSTIWV